jgi:hypothetical protein
MKLWHINRTDDVGYDEYDAVIIRAATANDAVTMLFDTHRSAGFSRYGPNYTVTELAAEGRPGHVLGSFNAG